MQKISGNGIEITKGNILFMVSACFLLLIITFYKYGDEISINDLLGRNKKVAGLQDITFEGLKAAHLSEQEEITFDDLHEAVKLDPDQAGEVLGITSEDNLDLPNVDDILALPIMKKVPLNIVSSNDQNKQLYALNSLEIDINPEAQKAYAFFTLQENRYKVSLAERKSFITKFLSIPVPNEKKYRDYHLLKFFYYQTLFEMMDLTPGTTPDLWEEHTSVYLALLERIEQLKSEIELLE